VPFIERQDPDWIVARGWFERFVAGDHRPWFGPLECLGEASLVCLPVERNEGTVAPRADRSR
jgi:hypothetical protein